MGVGQPVSRPLSALLGCLMLSACLEADRPLMPSFALTGLDSPQEALIEGLAFDEKQRTLRVLQVDTVRFAKEGNMIRRYEFHPRQGGWVESNTRYRLAPVSYDPFATYVEVREDHTGIEAEDEPPSYYYALLRRSSRNTTFVWKVDCAKFPPAARASLGLSLDDDSCRVASWRQVQSAIREYTLERHKPDYRVILKE